FVVMFLTVWFGYGFETGTLLQKKDTHPTLKKIFAQLDKRTYEKVSFAATNITIPAPSFFKGIGTVFSVASGGKHGSFMLGRHFRGGSLRGALLAFFIKTPIPLTIFFIIALILKRKVLLSKDQLFLLVPISALVLTTPLHISLHNKYILPVYPFLIIFSSQIFDPQYIKVRKIKVLLCILLAWLMFGTLRIYPHYLAYFNEFAGGPQNGYKFLVDSNLDWGQDLKLLKEYLDKNNIDEVALGYFGTARPEYYGIKYKKMAPFTPVRGWVAISATLLQGAHITAKDPYAWLRQYEPVAKIGYSIFVYDIGDKVRNTQERNNGSN
ncbi:MAG: hypothetical protein ABIJ27_00310, partial [Candidatus Omnitrophota bacterium]